MKKKQRRTSLFFVLYVFLFSEAHMLNHRNRGHIKCLVQIHVEQPTDPLGSAARASLSRKVVAIEHTYCEVFLGLSLAGVDAVNDLELIVFSLHQCGNVPAHTNNLGQNLGNESLLKSGKALCLVEADVVFEFLRHFVCRVVYFNRVVYCEVHICVCKLCFQITPWKRFQFFSPKNDCCKWIL